MDPLFLRFLGAAAHLLIDQSAEFYPTPFTTTDDLHADLLYLLDAHLVPATTEPRIIADLLNALHREWREEGYPCPLDN